MTNEERDLITQFIARAGGAPAQPAGFGGSVPATAAQPALPPIDRDADALIADQFNHYPEARYRITQMAFVQEHALVEAQNRINRLQWELQQAKQAQASPTPGQAGSPWGAGAQQPQQSRGFFGSLFGSGSSPQPAQQPQYAAPPPPQYAPNYNPGMFQQSQGSGFLGGALRTAAGVAGGVLAADALSNMFSGHHEGGGLFGGEAQAAGFGGTAGAVGGSTWGGGPAAGADPYDTGGAMKDDAGQDGKFGQGGQVDNSGWQTPDQGAQDPGGWDQGTIDSGSDFGGNDSGGWDSSGGSDSI